MIDIHAHLIPCVDDGSRSMENSLSMIKEQIGQGVTDIILTPHLRRRFACTKEELEEAFFQLKKAVKEKGLSVNLYLGREVYIKSNFIKDFEKNDNLLYLNGTKYILIEFDFSQESDVADVVYELSSRGCKSIVAHYERYDYATIDGAREIKDADGLIQVNADSILGKQGGKCKRLARQMLKEGLVDFVASDLHSNRKSCMQKAEKFVAKKYGKDLAEKVFNTNAQNILKG